MGDCKGFIVRFRNILLLTIFMNIVFLFNSDFIKIKYLIIGTIFLSIFYLYINILPRKENKLDKARLKIMVGGYELIVDSILSVILEVIIYFILFSIKKWSIDIGIIIGNSIVSFIIIGLTFINGFFRVLFTSRQLSILNRVLLLFLWWMPIVNIFLLRIWCKKVRYEYIYEVSKEELNKCRKENEICSTKYPIVLVHGIFFRDWMLINYWGRIPKALITNGAKIYYGKQQSSNPISKSGEELKENILKIIQETGAEKVNIIAHSKGGLDARYAISCLGLDKYVASLTTINTPHMGCHFPEYLLNKLPKGLINFVARKYNKIFKKLGDENPDFLAGVKDLTSSNLTEFNKNVLNAEGVLYQSVMSKMNNVFSAGFPLNIGYLLAKKFDGENDGLVSVDSGKWGDFLCMLTANKKGISHGDVIDLTRKDIKGFDVCEFYVDLVKKLKERDF